MCLVPGHNCRQCHWYWTWLITPGCCMEDHLVRYQEIMALSLHLDLPLEESIQLRINIIAGSSDAEALRRLALRRERAKLAETLGNPINWETMDMDELRNMVAAHQRGTQVPVPKTTVPKATTPAPATGAGPNQQQEDETTY